MDSVTNTSDVEIDESNNEFYDQSTIADTSSVMCMKSCFVRLERLDENSIKEMTRSKAKKPRKKTSLKSRSKLPPLVGKNFACDLCGFRSYRKINVATHMNARHSVNKVKCEICHKVYDSKTKFNLHFRTVHNKERQTFECLLCGSKSWKYKEYKSLKAHVEKSHSMDKSKITLTCDLCGEEFYSIKRLKNHMNSNHVVGPFKCFEKRCQMAFKGSQQRKNHYL